MAVLTKSGKEYSRSGMINLRSGINRHLTGPDHQKNIDLMQDQDFLQANKVFTGRMRDNKEKGLDVSQKRMSILKEDMEKLFNEYFKTRLEIGNTEVLMHKVFFDVVYYTGRRGKEGLKELTKTSFDVKVGPDNKEFVQINFNEKTKKNQGNSTSTAANTLHNDRHIISEIDGPLCPVKSFKKYLSLLNNKQTAFFQYPSKDNRGFTMMCIGKNSLGSMMAEISEKANLSKKYTNHQIRKTTVTAMHHSGYSLQEISNVTKHKNLDSLKHYIDGPTHAEQESYNKAMYEYAHSPAAPKRKTLLQQVIPGPTKSPRIAEEPNSKAVLPVQNPGNASEVEENEDGGMHLLTSTHNVVNNQLRSASHLFQNANFSNCNFTFTLPK